MPGPATFHDLTASKIMMWVVPYLTISKDGFQAPSLNNKLSICSCVDWRQPSAQAKGLALLILLYRKKFW